MSKSNIPNTRKNHASCVASVAECGEGTVAFFIKANTMSKDPAVLFYTSDFLTGTMFMTDEEVGQYIRLLCAQHQKGHLHPNDVLSICRTETSRVLTKFAKDQDGFYYNERMEVEQEKRKTYCDSRVKNLKRHKAPTAHMDDHMAVHMDNEDVIENENGIAGKETVLTDWNSLGEPFPKVVKIGSRSKNLSARWGDTWWRENYKTALDMIKTSTFCRGINDRNWIADFDFFLKPDTVARVIEGKYADRTKAEPPKKECLEDRIRRELAEKRAVDAK